MKENMKAMKKNKETIKDLEEEKQNLLEELQVVSHYSSGLVLLWRMEKLVQ